MKEFDTLERGYPSSSGGVAISGGSEVISRREYLKRLGSGALLGIPFGAGVVGSGGCAVRTAGGEQLFATGHLTASGSFTSGAEGPAVDVEGNIYAVNFLRQGTIGRITPRGEAAVFIELRGGSVANGIRINSRGEMFLADYTNHNVLKVDLVTRIVAVHAHEPRMTQPNDLAIGANDMLYASDPDWSAGTGQIWRVGTDGRTTLLEGGMGTTNGIEVGMGETTLYVNESEQRRVWAYDLSPAGEISNKRLLIAFADGGMDGMRCDIDGRLFVARHGLGVVAVVSPTGELLREIPIAAGSNPTNLAFGGEDGRTIYVSVADEGNLQTFRTDRPGREWVLLRDGRRS
jgi:gluconolactonase